VLALADRFWASVTRTDGCWEWLGTVLDSGYGQVWANGKRRRAHRVSWELSNGALPAEALVLHRCDNRKCVRPEHLYVGTHVQNMLDRSERERVHHPIGITHPAAKLTDRIVQNIRERSRAGETQRSLAKTYRVSQATISMVVTRKHWGHVA
jgi:hypothetical protein